MIRIGHIIKKDEIFTWVNNRDICRIELTRRKNEKLKDDSVCKIYAFHRVSISKDSNLIHGILGGCKKAIVENDAEIFPEKLSGSDHAYLNGIQNQIKYGWLSRSMIKELLEIQSRNPQINLSIPKKIITLVEKYKA
jgi:hypothetical protein